MGGYLSGRRGGRPTVESMNSIKLALSDVVLTRGRKPPPGMQFSGTRDNEPFSFVVMVSLDSPDRDCGTMRVRHDTIRHPTGSETGPQDYTLELQAGPCSLGGRRWWFVCPRTWRRCRTLYLPNGASRFASRAAYRLAYQSQRDGDMDRGHAKLARICRKVGAAYKGPDFGLPPQSKGMRRRTYDQLLEQWFMAEDQFEALFIQKGRRLLR